MVERLYGDMIGKRQPADQVEQLNVISKINAVYIGMNQRARSLSLAGLI
jgi:hypothetical protein